MDGACVEVAVAVPPTGTEAEAEAEAVSPCSRPQPPALTATEPTPRPLAANRAPRLPACFANYSDKSIDTSKGNGVRAGFQGPKPYAENSASSSSSKVLALLSQCHSLPPFLQKNPVPSFAADEPAAQVGMAVRVQGEGQQEECGAVLAAARCGLCGVGDGGDGGDGVRWALPLRPSSSPVQLHPRPVLTRLLILPVTVVILSYCFQSSFSVQHGLHELQLIRH